MSQCKICKIKQDHKSLTSNFIDTINWSSRPYKGVGSWIDSSVCCTENRPIKGLLHSTVFYSKYYFIDKEFNHFKIYLLNLKIIRTLKSIQNWIKMLWSLQKLLLKVVKNKQHWEHQKFTSVWEHLIREYMNSKQHSSNINPNIINCIITIVRQSKQIIWCYSIKSRYHQTTLCSHTIPVNNLRIRSNSTTEHSPITERAI